MYWRIAIANYSRARSSVVNEVRLLLFFQDGIRYRYFAALLHLVL